MRIVGMILALLNFSLAIAVAFGWYSASQFVQVVNYLILTMYFMQIARDN